MLALLLDRGNAFLRLSHGLSHLTLGALAGGINVFQAAVGLQERLILAALNAGSFLQGTLALRFRHTLSLLFRGQRPSTSLMTFPAESRMR